MERNILDPKEVERRLDEDFIRSLDMIGEGAPDYAPFEEDEASEELKREEAKAKELQ